jgi:hypothetical protein
MLGLVPIPIPVPLLVFAGYIVGERRPFSAVLLKTCDCGLADAVLEAPAAPLGLAAPNSDIGELPAVPLLVLRSRRWNSEGIVVFVVN